ncbi:MAG: FAD binding domain-containing protein [Spirochaetes bacterium]|nr:FAD binding domain-containing protein [Spirochaetota bacterium]
MEFLKITTLTQIISEVPKIKNRIYYLAGGTDLFVKIKEGSIQENAMIIDISDLKELKSIKETPAEIIIGALTPFSQIAHSFVINFHAPLLCQAAKSVGSLQIRNRGTLGGNIANASPAGDSLPALFVHDAIIVTLKRRISVHDFFINAKKTVLENGEIIKEIIIPKINMKKKAFFYKSAPREALALSKASLAVLAMVKNKKLEDIKIAAGAVGPTVIRTLRTEQFILRNQINSDVIAKAKNIMISEICPITDICSTDQYRREIIKFYLEEALRNLP